MRSSMSTSLSPRVTSTSGLGRRHIFRKAALPLPRPSVLVPIRHNDGAPCSSSWTGACRATAGSEDPETAAFKKALNNTEGVKAESPSDPDVLSGEELVQLIQAKWGARYDCRITRRRNARNQLRFYLQVMWKFLEQKSFPLSEDEYYEQLDAVASLVSEWGLADHVRKEIQASKQAPVIGNAIGGGAQCVSIPLLDADEVS
mmetsp:Transcript_15045/g.38227  ORF Transcript_15045/g.38227 Transcript_15045/m.38227 type:complete len:202 (-) Transcript_15045:142-747(-)